MGGSRIDAADARGAILGFACCQAFLYAVLFVGLRPAGDFATLARFDTLCSLVFLVCSFVLVFANRSLRNLIVPSNRFLLAVALLPLIGLVLQASLFFTHAPGLSLPHLLVLCACAGFPSGLALCGWGRALGAVPIAQSVPIVFIASALGAAFSFVVTALPLAAAPLALQVLLLPSVVLLRRFHTSVGLGSCGSRSLEGSWDQPGSDRQVSRLSGRIVAGTCVFGLAAGLIVAMNERIDARLSSEPSFVLLLFVVYCLAAIQLFGSSPLFSMRKILPIKDAPSPSSDSGPLDGAYRLAILLMLTGFFLAPLLSAAGVSSESVVLSGFMGLTAVLISLFIVMGHIAGRDSVRTFAQGFLALFAGEIGGALLGAVILGMNIPWSFALVAAASGIAVLYGYLFLFTDRELAALSCVVDETDRFEEACVDLTERFALSKREGEILPLALRGRTSERIAAEFFISKNTVDTHMRRIYAKCGVHSRQELIDLFEQTERSISRR